LTTGAASITEPLPLSQRAAFLEALAAELERYPAEARGHGLLHRLGRELQRTFDFLLAATEKSEPTACSKRKI
jgi:hypothetical protein